MASGARPRRRAPDRPRPRRLRRRARPERSCCSPRTTATTSRPLPGSEPALEAVEQVLPTLAAYPAHFILEQDGRRWIWRNRLRSQTTQLTLGDGASLPLPPSTGWGARCRRPAVAGGRPGGGLPAGGRAALLLQPLVPGREDVPAVAGHPRPGAGLRRAGGRPHRHTARAAQARGARCGGATGWWWSAPSSTCRRATAPSWPGARPRSPPRTPARHATSAPSARTPRAARTGAVLFHHLHSTPRRSGPWRPTGHGPRAPPGAVAQHAARHPGLQGHRALRRGAAGLPGGAGRLPVYNGPAPDQ